MTLSTSTVHSTETVLLSCSSGCGITYTQSVPMTTTTDAYSTTTHTITETYSSETIPSTPTFTATFESSIPPAPHTSSPGVSVSETSPTDVQSTGYTTFIEPAKSSGESSVGTPSSWVDPSIHTNTYPEQHCTETQCLTKGTPSGTESIPHSTSKSGSAGCTGPECSKPASTGSGTNCGGVACVGPTHGCTGPHCALETPMGSAEWTGVAPSNSALKLKTSLLSLFAIIMIQM